MRAGLPLFWVDEPFVVHHPVLNFGRWYVRFFGNIGQVVLMMLHELVDKQLTPPQDLTRFHLGHIPCDNVYVNVITTYTLMLLQRIRYIISNVYAEITAPYTYI